MLGIWIAHVYLKGFLNKYLSALLFLGFLGLFMLPLFHGKYVTVTGRILFSALVIIGTVSLNNRTTHNKLLNLLGDASYSIYLTHTVFSLRLSSIIWRQVPVEGWLQFTGWIIFSLTLSSAVGIIVYLYFEKPILNLLREKWKVLAINKFTRKMVKCERGAGHN